MHSKATGASLAFVVVATVVVARCAAFAKEMSVRLSICLSVSLSVCRTCESCLNAIRYRIRPENGPFYLLLKAKFKTKV